MGGSCEETYRNLEVKYGYMDIYGYKASKRFLTAGKWGCGDMDMFEGRHGRAPVVR